MNKKGFTLIELLAVIVILAIIALIATPIILNIISDSKEESNKRSVELYASAIKNAVVSEQLKGNIVTSIEDIDMNKYYDGNVECTTININEDGTVILAGCTVNGSSNTYRYGVNGVEKEEIQFPEEPTPIVKLCTANTTQAQAYVYKIGNVAQTSSYTLENVGLIKTSESDAYATGVAYTCNFIDDNESNNMTFFVLSESGENVTLISGSNLGGTVAWSKDGSDHKNDPEDQQAVTAKAALAERTAGWTKLTTEQKATIKLPTKAQIEGAYTGSMPKWLYSYTTNNVASGYWTASPYAGTFGRAWLVSHVGDLTDGGFVAAAGHYGVRPVITLSKSSIN